MSAQPLPSRAVATVSLLVHDYDTAIRFFTTALRFVLLDDLDQGAGKRWVVVAPPGGQGASLLLARAVTPQQQALVGGQGGGRVWLFLHSDDFWSDHAHMSAHGAQFLETPRVEPYGTVAVFSDLCGNKWDLIQRSAAPATEATP